MIKKIIELKNVGCFEHLRAASGNEGDFAKVNIVYAPNACGKTTLCDVFRSVQTRNPAYVMGRKRIGAGTDPAIKIQLIDNDVVAFCNRQWDGALTCPKIHVFDQRFVNDNVFVGGQIGTEQRRNVYNLALGETALRLNQEVEAAGVKLSETTTTATQCETILSSLIAPHNIETFRTIEKVDDVDTKITILTSRISAEKNKKSKADQIRRHGLLRKIAIPSLPVEDLKAALSTTLDNVALTAEEKIKNHLAQCVDTKKVTADWIRQGFGAQKNSICPYCGQDISRVELFTVYKVFFSGALRQQEEQRAKVKNIFTFETGDSAQAVLVNSEAQNNSDVEWWKDVCELSLDVPALDVSGIKEKFLSIANAVTSAIGRKQDNLTIAVLLQENEMAALNEAATVIASIKSYNDAIDSANDKIKAFQQSVEAINIEELENQLSTLLLKKKRYDPSVVDAYEKYDAAIVAKREAQGRKTQANEALKTESQAIFDSFGSKINEMLAAFGVNFSVKNDGVNLRGGAASGQLSIAINANSISERVDCTMAGASNPSCRSLSNTLSGGDCSALALAFFLAKLETDSSLGASIVVVDDPYHDQDRSRQTQTIQQLVLKANACSQFFLLSHNLEFAHMFLSNKGSVRGDIRAYKIEPFVMPVILEHGDLPPLASKAYETDYCELSDYVNNPGSYANRLKEVVGRIRPLLETYLRYKYPQAWNENDWLGDMVGKIQRSSDSDIIHPCACLVQKLESVKDYTKRFHHRVNGMSADVPEPRELKTYVEMTLEIIHHA